MSCTKQILGVQWEHHNWQRRVSGFELREGQETNMWGRPVTRNFVRCDVEEVCATCGAVRHPASCTCDIERGEACPPLVEWRQAHGGAGDLPR